MSKTIRFFAILALLSAGICLPEARAAYDIFMQIDGIQGESTDQNHPGWNELYSFSHGMSKATNSPPNHAQFSVMKRLDKSSTAVNLKLNQGALIPDILVEFQTPGGINEPVVFYKVFMENVTVTSVSSSGSGGSDVVTESVGITYRKITWTYYPIDPKTGKAGSPVSSFWDLATQKGG